MSGERVGGRRIRRRRALHDAVAALGLASFLVLCGCGGKSAGFEEQYHRGRQLLNDGDLDAAAQLARRQETRARGAGAADWAGAFQVLEAEVLSRSGRTEEAIRKLSGQPPVSRSDVRARWSAVLAYDTCTQAAGDKTGQGAESFRRAGRLLEDAERAATQAGRDVQADVQLRQAGCLIRERRFDAADRVLRQLLDLTRAAGLRFSEGSALVTRAAERFYAGHPEDCLTDSKDALAIGRQIPSDVLTLKSLINLGLCYTSVGDYDNALGYLEQAESIAPKRQLADDLRNLFTNTGNLYFYLGDYSRAAGYYTRALDLARQTGKDSSVAILLGNLGEAAMSQGDLAGAARYSAEALHLKEAIRAGDSLKRSQVLAARIRFAQGDTDGSRRLYQTLLDPKAPDDVIWQTHAGLAEIQAKVHQNADAEREFRAAIAVVESSRDSLKLVDSKITFQSSLSDLYENYVAFLARNRRVDDALLAADRSRATMLARRLGQADSNTQPLSAARVRSLARETRSVLLSYWLAPEKSILWVVTPAGVKQFDLPPRADIQRMIEAYQRVVESPRDALRDAAGTGAALWNTLIGPAQKLIPSGSRVLVVADRELHLLNFETLIVPEPIPHFWIEDVTVAEAPSFGALSQPAQARDADSILLMGNPAPADPDFPPLPNSGTEVQSIGDLFPAADRTVLTGAAATPDAYLESTPRRFRYIHFAAHATANRVSPLDSAVVFARSHGGYRLYARDVLKQPLDAEIVTVSACRSAGARAYSGEGLVGFAWAFLGAGANNVVAGLWKVEDSSTAQLMLQFYRELRLGRPPETALRDAKLGLLRSGTAYRRPFYWAPFLLYTRVR